LAILIKEKHAFDQEMFEHVCQQIQAIKTWQIFLIA